MTLETPFEIDQEVFIIKKSQGLVIKCNIEYMDMFIIKGSNKIQWHISTNYREAAYDVQHRIPAEECFKTKEEAFNALRTFEPEFRIV